MYPFTFEVLAVDAIEGSFCYRESGIGFCKNFTEAMNYIENYYGDILVKVMELELMEEDDLIFLPKKYINEYKEKNFSTPDIITPCDFNGNLLKSF